MKFWQNFSKRPWCYNSRQRSARHENSIPSHQEFARQHRGNTPREYLVDRTSTAPRGQSPTNASDLDPFACGMTSNPGDTDHRACFPTVPSVAETRAHRHQHMRNGLSTKTDKSHRRGEYAHKHGLDAHSLDGNGTSAHNPMSDMEDGSAIALFRSPCLSPPIPYRW